jgi:hypothetical protein
MASEVGERRLIDSTRIVQKARVFDATDQKTPRKPGVTSYFW